MNLHQLLRRRTEAQGPLRIGVIGAGKFASMFFTQALGMPEMHVVAVAELDVARAADAMRRTGYDDDRYDAGITPEQAAASGRTALLDDAFALIASPAVEIVLEVTGHPVVGVRHALAAIDEGKHLVMVNVEADCLVGPELRRRADAAGVVYSMAYGDQPALIAELVDWCRTVGYDVVAAGKGTKYLPAYELSTPDTVWDHYGLTPEQIATGGFNPQMFNSFLDGTKSAIEMAAVANATGLRAPEAGLAFPAVSVDDLSSRLVPVADGGVLDGPGTVEVISSLERDGTAVERDLRWGVYVTFAAPTDYARACFAEYGVRTDPSGRYGSLYRPYHMIGMELGVSVASAVLRGEATGAPIDFAADVVATAKRDLVVGETLDGEGGYTVRGALTTAARSLANGALPLGLAHGARMTRPVAAGATVAWDDVELAGDEPAVTLRRAMEDGARAGLTPAAAR